MRQRCDETGTKWIICYSEDNRNSRSCLLRRGDCRSRRNNDIDLEPHELIGNRGVVLFAPLRPAIFDSDCSTFDPAKLVQPLHKSSDPRAPSRKSSCAEKPDRPELRSLLRECRERPRHCAASRASDGKDSTALLRCGISIHLMSGWGQIRSSDDVRRTTALTSQADPVGSGRDV